MSDTPADSPVRDTPIQCPHCGRKGKVRRGYVGQAVRCTHCRKAFVLRLPENQETVTADFHGGERLTHTQDVAPQSAQEPGRPAAVEGPGAHVAPSCIGRFVIRQKVGEGAFGSVYRAYDPTLEREIALKLPRNRALDDPRGIERFLREARAAARLVHPHVVPVYEAGFQDGTPYIATAFIEGLTLDAARGDRTMDPRYAATIVRNLAQGVHAAHCLGIVHRDIKPSNVLLDASGRALLTDFGLARREESADRLTHEGAILGTPAYMAPEQASGSDAGRACDQYSLGVILYELLCGRRPFAGALHVVLHDVIHKTPVPPSQVQPGLPAELEAVCLKTMAKSPADRYASCEDLANALGRWLERSLTPLPSVAPAPLPTLPGLALPLDIEVSTQSSVALRPSPSVSHPAWRWVVAGAIVAGLLVLVLAGFAWQRDEPRTGGSRGVAGQGKSSGGRPGRQPRPAGGGGKVALREGGDKYPALPSIDFAPAADGLDKDTPGVPVLASLGPEEPKAVAPIPAPPADPDGPLKQYASTIAAAQKAIQAKDLDAAREMLDACPDPLRGWEWFYCRRLSAERSSPSNKKKGVAKRAFPDVLVLEHGDTVRDVAFSHNSRYLVTNGYSKPIGLPVVFDLTDGSRRELDVLENRERDWVVKTGYASSAVGEFIVLLTYAGNLLFVSAAPPFSKVFETSQITSGPNAPMLAISADGRYVLSYGGNQTKYAIWDCAELPAPRPTILLNEFPAAPFGNASFSPDGRLVALACTNAPFRVFNTRNQRDCVTIERSDQYSTSFVDNGSRVVVFSSRADMKEWVETYAVQNEILVSPAISNVELVGQSGAPTCVAISPIGRRVATGGGDTDRTVRLWDMERGVLLLTLAGHQGAILGLVFSPDGEKLATWAQDGTIRIWLAPKPPPPAVRKAKGK